MYILEEPEPKPPVDVPREVMKYAAILVWGLAIYVYTDLVCIMTP
jgi:hypothetical protein